MNATELQKHISATYLTLRLGVAGIALAFPLLLWVGGIVLTHTELQSSMSLYYHTPVADVVGERLPRARFHKRFGNVRLRRK